MLNEKFNVLIIAEHASLNFGGEAALPKSEWKAPSFSYGDEHGGGFNHLE